MNACTAFRRGITYAGLKSCLKDDQHHCKGIHARHQVHCRHVVYRMSGKSLQMAHVVRHNDQGTAWMLGLGGWFLSLCRMSGLHFYVIGGIAALVERQMLAGSASAAERSHTCYTYCYGLGAHCITPP